MRGIIEDKAKADAIAKKFLLKNDISFWKDVKKLCKVGSDVLASTVDSVTGEDNICKMWHDHYSKWLNSNSDTTYKSYVESTVKSVSKCKFNKLCYYEVNDAKVLV